MPDRIRLGLLYGGLSTEHEVSIESAANIFAAADTERFDVVLLWIDQEGAWHHVLSPRHLQGESVPSTPIVLAPRRNSGFLTQGHTGLRELPLDVVFPVLHGTNGEDGTVQGLLEVVGIAYVGAGVLSSAACMDKHIAKRLLAEAGLPVGKFRAIRRGAPPRYDELVAHVGTPFFLKPSNAGSSVGITKVRTSGEYKRGLDTAFRYDDKVLAEQYLRGREIECSVSDGIPPIVSVPGEIQTSHEFYTYEAKYLDEAATELIIPAPLERDIAARVRQLASEAFSVLECEGMARVDFFVTANFGVYISELNTIPGFTSQSMFPLLWQASGISYSELVTNLVHAGLARYEARQRLRYVR